MITDGAGTPLKVITTGGDVPDVSRGGEPARRRTAHRRTTGRPRRRFPVLLADKGYDGARFRNACQQRQTEPIIPPRGRKTIKGLGRLRYVVEQCIALLHQFRRLAIRWERHIDLHEAHSSASPARSSAGDVRSSKPPQDRVGAPRTRKSRPSSAAAPPQHATAIAQSILVLQQVQTSPTNPR